jgi:hypothetical protein
MFCRIVGDIPGGGASKRSAHSEFPYSTVRVNIEECESVPEVTVSIIV